MAPVRLGPISEKQQLLEALFINNRQLPDSLLWGSTVGYPSDSLASCLYHGISTVVAVKSRCCLNVMHVVHNTNTASLIVLYTVSVVSE